MNTRQIKVKSSGKASGAFLFRRSRRGPAEQLTLATGKISRSKASSK